MKNRPQKHLNPDSKAFLDREVKELSDATPEPPKCHYFGEEPKRTVKANTERRYSKYAFWQS